MKRPAIFFDRDNTLIVSDGYLGDPSKVVLIAGAAEAVVRARRLGFAVVVFSNQSGVARGMFSEEDVQAVNRRMDELLRAQDPQAIIDRHEYCPFHPEGTIDVYARESDRRKPRPGMIQGAARVMSLDLERSWVIGDAARDIEAGKAAGCRAILFDDPGIPKSPAAEKPPRVEPDAVVPTLSAALEFVEAHREEPKAAAATPAIAAQDVIMPPAEPVEKKPESAAAAVAPGKAPAAQQPIHPEPSQPAPALARASGRDAMDAAAPAVTLAPVREPSLALAHHAAPSGAGAAAAKPHLAERPAARVENKPAPAEARPAPSNENKPPAPRGPKVVIGSKYVAPGASPRPDVAGEAAATPAERPAGAPKKPWRDDNAPQPPEPPASAGRVESLLEQIFLELRRQHEHKDGDFSVSKLLAGVVQVLVVAVLVFAYMQSGNVASVQTHLLLAVTLQAMTISLLIMSRQK